MGRETEYDEEASPLVGVKQGDRSASKVDVKVSHDLGDRTLVVVVLLAAIIGVCGVVIGMDLSERRTNNDRLASSEKEARLVQYYINEVDGKLIHAGFIEPRDRWSPEKRKQYEEGIGPGTLIDRAARSEQKLKETKP